VPSIAEWLTPRVEVEVGGARRRLLFTHSALLEVEDLTGIDVMESGIKLWGASATLLRVLLAAALHGGGWAGSLEEAGSAIGAMGVRHAQAALTGAWVVSMPEADPEEKQGKPAEAVKISWREAWAIARVDLKLGDAEWLALTPRLVKDLSRERLEEKRQAEFMLSQIAAAAANFGGRGPEKALPGDWFMIHKWPAKEVTAEDISAALGGNIFN